ncbi:MAG: tetratricopeptide repeat protein, partial [bacterium]
MKCPQCGFDNPASNKFCGECGFNLFSFASIERMDLVKKTIPENLVKKIISIKDTIIKERRNVTVVFADISGFTAMSEKIDPEELTILMNECFRKLGMMVYRYEGIIDKFIGDCIMAIFGAPVSHEDDPERALLASMDMQTALEEINQQLGSHLKKLEIHTGINTGEAIAGKVGSDLQMEYTVMGDTVNVAQRLKDIAPPGTILVGPETYKRTKHAFDFIHLEPIQLKGKEESITPFEVVGKKWGAEYGLGSFHSDLVGRTAELNRLKMIVNEIKEKSRIFLINGEIGVGKSRLLYELKKIIAISAPEIVVLEARGISYETLIPYKPFADCLRRYFVSSTQQPRDMKNIIAERLRIILQTEYKEIAPYLFKFLNLDIEEEERTKIEYLDAHSLQIQILLAITTLLEKIAATNPIFLIIDNIQWLDSGSIEIINFILPLLKKLKMVLCLSYRTGEFKQIENLLSCFNSQYKNILEELRLDNLSYEASINLIENLLGKEIDENLKKYIFNKSNGNPFFIEEISRKIIEEGLPESRKAIKLDKIELPGSIETAVTARCDGLSKEAKYILKIASVIGRSFPKNLIEEIIREKELLNKLDELESAELLVRINQGKDIFYTFRHPIFQEVSYHSLLKSERAIYHKIIAETIESKFQGTITGSASLLAHHYYECKEFSKAAEYALKAGDEASSLFANEEAIKHYELAANCSEDKKKKAEALEKLADILSMKADGMSDALKLYEQAMMLQDDKIVRAGIKGKIGKVYVNTGRIDQGIEVMHSALKEIEDSNSLMLSLLAYQLSDMLLELKSDSKQAEKMTDFGIKIARNIGDQESELLGMRMKSQILWRQGHIDDALKILNDCENRLEKLKNPQSVASFYLLLGAVYRAQGNLTRAIEYCQRSNEISKKIGNQRFLAFGLNNLGIYYELLGDIKTAIDYYNKNIALRIKLGDKRGEAVGYFNLGTLKTRIGDMEDAMALYENALRIAQEISDIRVLVNCKFGIANILIDMGNLSLADKHLKEVEKIAGETEEDWMKCELQYYYSKYYFAQGDNKNALEYLLHALDTVSPQTSKEMIVRYYIMLAEIYLQENNEQALSYVEEGLKMARNLNDKYDEIS